VSSGNDDGDADRKPESLDAALETLAELLAEDRFDADGVPILNDVFGRRDDDDWDAPEDQASARIAAIVGELERVLEEELAIPPPIAQPPLIATSAALTGTPTPMEKTYDPRAIETRWYEHWEAQGYFRPAGDGPAYCIALPPPNVTGSLHMGHAFQSTLMDALIRYHRMRGDRALWQCGTDHAGIATQIVVERQLAAQGRSRHALGRSAFIEKVWEWKAQSGGTITRQLRRLGASMDWSRERFTLDEGLSRAVTEVFVRLHGEGLVYRGQRLVNWDPVLRTAISDLEVVAQEEQGELWHLRYPRADGQGYVVVATTRPETMLGDCAVAVHPDDERYRALIGQELILPLGCRRIPVIADEYVDPAFGSGCVKITPAHDFNDYAVWQRHRGEGSFARQPCGGLINVFRPDASIKSTAADDAGGHGAAPPASSTAELIPPAYRGLDRYEARKRVVADLRSQGLLDAVQAHKLVVPRGDRSQAVIEPYLTDQWFVRARPLAEPAIRAVEEGRIRFVPENWAKTYFEWMRNIEDWCISRQLWWGHRIPAWYDAAGGVYVGRDEAEVRARHALGAEVTLTQDEDVLDTWFSSALWPFSTLGWPDATEELETFYPTSVLVTGFDIIFFWVARMIMMGLKFVGDVPFREVCVHGLVRDQDGQKMSKSKGNILDPIDLIDGVDLESLVAKRTSGLMRPQDAPKIAQATRKQFAGGIPAHGTDALRYTFASLASLGRNVNFDLGRIEGYRNFCNKLWNASRFVLLSVDAAPPREGIRFGVGERWIGTRLQSAIATTTEALAQYRFDLAAQAIYEFVWDDYCDWYLEYAKTVLNGPTATAADKDGTRLALIEVLETVLRLAHPLIPFITEEIWQRVAPLAGTAGPSVSLAPYPAVDAAARDEEAVAEFEWLKAAVLGVRRIRAEMDIAPGKPLAVIVTGGTAAEQAWLQRNCDSISALARLASITRQPQGADPPQSATALAGAMTLLVPLADLIDPVAEAARLRREIDKVREDIARMEKKLANPNFVDRAPAEVVGRERTRLADQREAASRLGAQLARIQSLLP
jgi:valyl-tRNA synthetase